MTCRELAEFIADYLVGELAADVRDRFEQHLAVCPNCQKYLRSYTETTTLGKRAFDDDSPLPSTVPEELIQAILAARGTGF